MHLKDDIFAYRKGLLQDKKYSLESQIYLKRRVFDTFHNLLIHRGLEGLIYGKKLLDLGAADLSFVKVCKENGLDNVIFIDSISRTKVVQY